MALNPDCVVDVSTPQIKGHVVYPLYAQLYGADVVKQQYSFWDKSLAFRSYRGLRLIHLHVTASSTIHSLTLFLEVHQYRAIGIPKDGHHDFPSRSLCLELFLAVDNRCFHCIDCLLLSSS